MDARLSWLLRDRRLTISPGKPFLFRGGYLRVLSGVGLSPLCFRVDLCVFLGSFLLDVFHFDIRAAAP